MNKEELADVIEHYLSTVSSRGMLEVLDSVGELKVVDEDADFMRQCREHTTDVKKCEYCDLKFKCYTEAWKEPS